MEGKEMQTDNGFQCSICKKAVVRNELFIEDEKIICGFKRVEFCKDGWEEVKEIVKDLRIYMDRWLDQWSKVMEDYHRG